MLLRCLLLLLCLWCCCSSCGFSHMRRTSMGIRGRKLRHLCRRRGRKSLKVWHIGAPVLGDLTQPRRGLRPGMTGNMARTCKRKYLKYGAPMRGTDGFTHRPQSLCTHSPTAAQHDNRGNIPKSVLRTGGSKVKRQKDNAHGITAYVRPGRRDDGGGRQYSKAEGK